MEPVALSGARIALRHLRRGFLTRRKLTNLALNLARGYLLGRDVLGPHPSVLVVENTSACNLACPGCGFQMRVRDGEVATRHLALERFQALVDECQGDLCAIFFYLGGEPFLRADAFAMIRYATDRRVPVLASTNGSFAIPSFGDAVARSGLDTLIVSISGTTQEVYARYHAGGRLDRVLATLRDLVDAKRRGGAGPEIVLRFIVFDHNVHQVPEARALARALGVDTLDVRDDEALVWREAGEPTHHPTAVATARRRAARSTNFCWYPWSVMVLRADAAALPCCYDYMELPELGRVGAGGVSSIWNGDRYRAFRRAMLEDRGAMPACGGCDQGAVPGAGALSRAARWIRGGVLARSS